MPIRIYTYIDFVLGTNKVTCSSNKNENTEKLFKKKKHSVTNPDWAKRGGISRDYW